MTRSPIKRRRPRKRKDADAKYLRFIRSLACLICLPGEQLSITEAAHVGERGLGQRCADRESIPLCALHHREGKTAIHVIGRQFWRFHGIVKIKVLQALHSRYDSD